MAHVIDYELGTDLTFRNGLNGMRNGFRAERITLDYLRDLRQSTCIMHDVRIYVPSGSSQLDFIICHKNGIFIIENKNVTGKIIGKYDNDMWRQKKTTRSGFKYAKQFYNPIKQVLTHKMRLEEFFQQYGYTLTVQPILYFSNENVKLDVERRKICHVSSNPCELVHFIENKDDPEQKITSDTLFTLQELFFQTETPCFS